MIKKLRKKIATIVANLIPGHIKAIKDNAYASGYNLGKKTGYEAGKEDGYRTGDSVGYQKGFEAGKEVWVIEDNRKPTSPQPLDRSIYGPERFKIANEMRDKMCQAVAVAVAKKIIDQPTPAQWEMIFSNSPATCVIAGAGSGKSTTLILRVVFLLEYLKVPQHEITVVSFTTASCEELRHSLIRVLAHWQKNLSDKQAKQLVRTFHSALYRVARSVFGGIQFFENISQNGNKQEGDDEDVENPFSTSKLGGTQLNLVKDAYVDLFGTDTIFQKHIMAMLEIECNRDITDCNPDREYNNFVLGLASKRDADLIRTVNERWKANGYWPDTGITEGPIQVFTAEGFAFYANGVITDNGMPVFLGGFQGEASLFSNNEKITADDDKESIGIYAALKVKKNIVDRYYGNKSLYPNSRQAAERLQWRIQHLTSSKLAKDVPIFDIKLDGEIKYASIYEALFSQANFIESMGLEVPYAISKMKPFRSECLEYHFCNAISRYWLYFESILQKKGIVTFNRAFLLLSKNNHQRNINWDLLRPFHHLLIDEFQDISPQIVSWLLNCQRQLVAREEKDKLVSLMAIGDDWQSIYGWRGSAPDFFIKFDSHFPSHSSVGKALVCKMEENFRSIRPIVCDAELLLKPILNKTTKISKPTRDAGPDDHGIKVIECGEYNNECLDKISRFILEQYKYAQSRPNSHKNKVIVMSKRNGILDTIEEKVGNQSGLVFYTYHRAKGLQGEVAIMIEDCIYDQNHKLRNRVYGSTGLFSEEYDYDQAMRDEAFRLAYVGATRGRSRVFWFVDEAKGAAKQIVNSGIPLTNINSLS